MRKEMLECHDSEKIDRFLQQARVGFLGLDDDDGPYVVPVNFVWADRTLYFHGAEAGRKADIIRSGAPACFTVCEEYATMAHAVPAHTSTAYLSVMLFGQACPLTDPGRVTEAMQRLLDKYVPGYFRRSLAQAHVEKYRSKLGSRTVVYCLRPERMTAKENPLDPQQRFIPGQHAGES
jgi:nitroimidazol reductase NimA-like FMN-containing flavoprotein (pyridoxamine 5'-phosphate oxidase superfamily)